MRGRAGAATAASNGGAATAGRPTAGRPTAGRPTASGGVGLGSSRASPNLAPPASHRGSGRPARGRDADGSLRAGNGADRATRVARRAGRVDGPRSGWLGRNSLRHGHLPRLAPAGPGDHERDHSRSRQLGEAGRAEPPALRPRRRAEPTDRQRGAGGRDRLLRPLCRPVDRDGKRHARLRVGHRGPARLLRRDPPAGAAGAMGSRRHGPRPRHRHHHGGHAPVHRLRGRLRPPRRRPGTRGRDPHARRRRRGRPPDLHGPDPGRRPSTGPRSTMLSRRRSPSSSPSSPPGSARAPSAAPRWRS